MEKTILRKRTSDGRTVDIRLHQNSPGWFVAHVYVDGQYLPGPARPVEMEEPERGCTHYLGGGYGDRPVVELAEVEAELVLSALAKAERDTRFRQAGGRRTLEARRRDLMLGYRRLLQRQQSEHEAAMAAGRPDAGQVRRAYEPRLAAAEQAIREFDREHPDVVEAVVKEMNGESD